MLDAARQLFEEVGYEAATIREIARRAGVSVGSVFTGFESKSHVLLEVVSERLGLNCPRRPGTGCAPPARLGGRPLPVAVHGPLRLRVPAVASLFLAHISLVAFEWREDSDMKPVPGTNRRLRGMIRECLAEGVARGDVRPEVDLDLAVDLLIGAYVWNYRLAATCRRSHVHNVSPRSSSVRSA